MDTKALDTEEGLLEAFERATRPTKEFRLCPNRVWAVAKEKLPKLMPGSKWIPGNSKSETGDEMHELCTFDFCEYSQRDFTAVQQRHECKEKQRCRRLQYLFSRDTLEAAAENEKSTVWGLNGKSMMEPTRPFMAISHVWSDGTGTGTWPDGEVNECLYTFFRGIARQFQCEGIWWDTLCIPRGKAARTKAIHKIQSNYQDARITLVHDCFLRSWEWHPETACFGILMSPWFSRGWTAVELANSRKVKVIFRGPCGPLIKDLDEEILANRGETGPRKEASDIIKNLRKGITVLDDLLTVLGPRHTSWPKDIAIISGLLVGVTPTEWQQDIYKDILRKMGSLSPGHLFHNAATMLEVSWCPTSLLSMPIAHPERADSSRADSDRSLRIAENWDLIGKWNVIPVNTNLREKCFWNGTHALVKAKAHKALTHPDKCRLLAEPGVGLVDKALLVKVIENGGASRPLGCQYVGALYFRPAMPTQDIKEHIAKKGKDLTVREVTLLGDPNDGTTPGAKGGKDQKHSNSDIFPLILAASSGDEKAVAELLRPLILVDVVEPVSQRTALHYAIWRGHRRVFSQLIEKKADPNAQDRLGQQPLHLAAERGDKYMVSELPKAETEWNAQCNHRQTALHRAAWGGSEAVVELLLKRGIDRSIKDKDGNMALHISAEKGFKPVVERLIGEEFWLANVQGRSNLTPLHYAAMNGHEEVVQLLLGKGAGLDAKDNQIGWTPLHCAAENRHEEVVQLLLGKGAKVDAKDNLDWTPLHCAAVSGHEEVVKLLIEQCPDLDTKDKEGWTALQLAKVKGSKAITELLRGKGAKADAKVDKGSWTPLHCVAMNGQEAVAKLLVDDSTNINFHAKEDDAYWSPLHWAAENGQRRVVRMLIEMGAKVNAKDATATRRTPLHVAAQSGHQGVIRLLLEMGAEVNAKDARGWMPLDVAAENGHEGVVELLVKGGAKVNAEGWTPLHAAAQKGHEGLVRLLVKMGAEVDAKYNLYWTPLHVAAQSGCQGVIRLLLEMGAEVDAKDARGWTPLYIAAENGEEEVVKLLVKGGAKVNAKGWTPLHVAAENGFEGVVELLIEMDAKVDAKDATRRTPLHVADENGHEGVVRLLEELRAAINA
ncbi:hypothetical protein IL306_011349 [Fusarium sp. DS 682]|nr:hypothetical protein IL306_011349 [Fusarium sp. DS 682]